MKKFSILTSTILGLITGLFVILSQMTSMDYEKWLTINNSLVFSSILVCGLIGIKSKSAKHSLIHGGLFVLIFMTFYVSGYILSTTVFLEELEWIPFDYKDYTYHGYQTVKEYLSAGDNYSELLKLQIFSVGVSSLIYLASNCLGLVGRKMFESGRLRTG